jgi:hypothetical protein
MMEGRSTTASPRGREEMRDEITMVLRFRRKVYGSGFLVFVLVVLGIALATSWTDPGVVPIALLWAGSAILGTGAIVLLGYQTGKSALYEKAGRNLLGER